MNLVLLSGGSGQRLWPLSNDIRSKQFIKIFHREDGELESMIQRVYRQIKTVDTDATVTIATSKSQVSAIRNQLGEEVGISVEPCRRDTSPAIALAAAYLKDVQGVGEEESVVVCPVDPYVENDYFEALKALGDRAAVSSANLVLMGIEPTNRMNIYTVAKASQGLADYLKKNFAEPSVAIGYDSRIKSDVFAKVAAGVFAANGVKVNIWPVLMPVPTVSFATRYLHTSAGVMVTASHNPSKYNGYKVYAAHHAGVPGRHQGVRRQEDRQAAGLRSGSGWPA